MTDLEKKNLLSKYQTFIFDSYSFDWETGEAVFRYAFDDKIAFEEVITYNLTGVTQEQINVELFDRVLFMTHLMLGVSYWKLYCPSQMQINTGTLTQAQADFWTNVYEKGFGEFYYKNQIDWHGLVNFPVDSLQAPKAVDIDIKPNYLVPIGGGKDSLVTVELLKQKKVGCTLFSVRDYPILKAVEPITGLNRLIVGRKMDAKLFDLNEGVVFNGHVPRTAINAVLALGQAVLSEFSTIVFSSERSANHGNVEYLGEEINHQYSKSFIFEKLLHEYITENISSNFSVFSLLRPLSELQIVELFSQLGEKYFQLFSSCNANFTQNNQQDVRWCCSCSKCLFVHICLAMFLDEVTIKNIFGGDVFNNKALLSDFIGLTGFGETKPFECVGTPAEVLVAMETMYEQGKFQDTYLMHYYVENIRMKVDDFEILRNSVFSFDEQNLIPSELLSLVS